MVNTDEKRQSPGLLAPDGPGAEARAGSRSPHNRARQGHTLRRHQPPAPREQEMPRHAQIQPVSPWLPSRALLRAGGLLRVFKTVAVGGRYSTRSLSLLSGGAADGDNDRFSQDTWPRPEKPNTIPRLQGARQDPFPPASLPEQRRVQGDTPRSLKEMHGLLGGGPGATPEPDSDGVSSHAFLGPLSSPCSQVCSF